MPTIHLIANAHLDPVWLWDWREGLNEGISTCRTVLNLMDEFPELSFIRGESAIYEHIERYDAATFERIRQMVDAGRWDIVGGTYIQPDTNLTGERTLRRHFEKGLEYFSTRFGKCPTIAWAADSFGHSAGLPRILVDAGVKGFAFTRPAAKQLPLGEGPFWWESPDGARVLAYRPEIDAYYSERDDLVSKLDRCLALLQKSDIAHIGCFYGIGNHGGGPTRRHVQEIESWRATHPEVQVVHSGLHRLFEAFFEQVSEGGDDIFPVHRGELNFCLRGCYASLAKLKFIYRQAEAAVARADATCTTIAALTQTTAPDLAAAEDALLFNSFHDILPGTAIERALDEQIQWLGGALHQCRNAEMAALNTLSSQIDTTVSAVEGDFPTAVPFLLWNPHPHPYRGLIELETCIDQRPIFTYTDRPADLPLEVRGAHGNVLPFQLMKSEHNFLNYIPWRPRVIVPVDLPPQGWEVVTLGYVEGAEKPAETGELTPVKAEAPGAIDNGIYRVEAEVAAESIHILHRGRDIFDGTGLSFVTLDDPWGTWGGMDEEPESFNLTDIRAVWRIEQVNILEDGPLRACLWVRLTAGSSWIELTISLSQGREAVDVAARLLWDERAARLKLVLPVGDEAEFEVPAATVRRKPCGEVPGGRWVRVFGEQGRTCGFAGDALYSFDALDGALRPTIVRATRYAAHDRQTGDSKPWMPTTDCGELRFKFLLSPGGEELPILARELEMPPLVATTVASPGKGPRSGSHETPA